MRFELFKIKWRLFVALINSGKFSQQNKINTYNEATIMEQFCPKNEEEENLKK